MSPTPTPPRATSTTLRALPRAMVLGLGDAAEAMTIHLMQQGYLANAVESASEALAALHKERFDLLLLDAGGSSFDAAQFVADLRADEELSKLPVLVRSAAENMDAIERCLAAGADDYLPTEFGPTVLKIRLNAAIDRQGSHDNQSMRRDMATARNIQRDFLPESLPQTRGVQLEAALHPAREVSGDFYDAFLLTPSGNIVMVVGDVCDKGVGAALFMALFRSLIRASADPVGGGAIQMIGGRRTLVMQSLESASPADLLTRVAGFTNNYIARLHGRTNMFATVFMAVLDPDYGSYEYLNAGHEPALIIAPDGTVTELRPTGPALGMMPDSTFRTAGGTLERGHSLFAFTDGLVEARSPSGEVYGSERLREVVRAHAAAGASSLVTGVVDALKAFGRQAEPHDDLTLLAATRRQ
jgi:phosphoserine phosphatase RsbU/P